MVSCKILHSVNGTLFCKGSKDRNLKGCILSFLLSFYLSSTWISEDALLVIDCSALLKGGITFLQRWIHEYWEDPEHFTHLFLYFGNPLLRSSLNYNLTAYNVPIIVQCIQADLGELILLEYLGKYIINMNKPLSISNTPVAIEKDKLNIRSVT